MFIVLSRINKALEKEKLNYQIEMSEKLVFKDEIIENFKKTIEELNLKIEDVCLKNTLNEL